MCLREVVAEMLPAVSASAFPEYGIDPTETAELLQAVHTAIGDMRMHAYLPVHTMWAQKPLK